MPLYYFDLQDSETISDNEGTDLPDAAAALLHAGEVARELTAGQRGEHGRDWGTLRLSVRDGDGHELFQLPLSDFEDKTDG
jgi:hypothetical protein